MHNNVSENLQGLQVFYKVVIQRCIVNLHAALRHSILYSHQPRGPLTVHRTKSLQPDENQEETHRTTNGLIVAPPSGPRGLKKEHHQRREKNERERGKRGA